VATACGGDDDDDGGTAADAPASDTGSTDSGASESTGDGGSTGTTSVGSEGSASTTPGGEVPADADLDATLRLVGANAPQQMDPVRETSNCSESMLGLIYDRLIRVTPDAQLVPGLAASWSSPDPTTFELVLQEGVTFQDGTPFDADAVVQHLTRARDLADSVLAGNLAAVETIEAVDDLTVRLTLNAERAGVLPYVLSGRTGMVPSPTALGEAGDAYGSDNAVGAGPYRYVENTPNDYMRLERWEGYWQPESQLLAGVEHNGFNPTFQVERLTSGELNYVTIFDNQFPDVEGAAESGSLEYQVTPAPQYGELFVNIGRAPFDDVRVRQALNHAIDRDLIAEIVTGGSGTAAWGPLPEYSSAHNADVEGMYPYDPERARELLAEAGFADGITIRTAFVGNPYYQVSAEALQVMLADAGITLELESVPPAEINNAIYVRQDFDAAVTAFLAPDDPGLALELKFGSTGNNNPSQVATEGLDELLAEGAATTDPDERAAIYQEAEMLVMEQALSVPLYRNAGVAGYAPEVRNVPRGYTTCQLGDFITPPVYVAG
jgi:peptide/nickel transport system substrate-binding protein